LARFPNYLETLSLANNDHENQFTTIEDLRHQTNHATIGSLLARSWGLSPDVALAIRLHHEYSVMQEAATPDAVRALIALSLLAERAIQLFEGKNNHVEWEKGGELACATLDLTDDEMADKCDELHTLFYEEEK
jgi:HD-like signal output (HDOD) protein